MEKRDSRVRTGFYLTLFEGKIANGLYNGWDIYLPCTNSSMNDMNLRAPLEKDFPPPKVTR